jgi:hypothetical protein
MSKIKYLADVKGLRKVFRYNPETGILYRRNREGEERPCGSARLHEEFARAA